MKNRTTTFILFIAFSAISYAWVPKIAFAASAPLIEGLRVEVLDTNTSQEDLVKAVNFISDMNKTFQFDLAQHPIKIKFCGYGSQACSAWGNAYYPEEQTLVFEIRRKTYFGKIRVVDFEFTQHTLAHEYAHHVFRVHMGQNDVYQRAFHLTQVTEKYRKLTTELQNAIEKKPPGNNNEMRNYLEDQVKMLEENYKHISKNEWAHAHRVTSLFSYYNELFADLMAAVYFSNPKTMCLGIEAGVCSVEETIRRQFDVQISNDGMKWGAHTVFAASRYDIWLTYQKLLNQGRSKSYILEKLARLFIQQAELNANQPENESEIVRWNSQLIEALNKVGR